MISGGTFTTRERSPVDGEDDDDDGACRSPQEEEEEEEEEYDQRHCLERGDALVFVSHKFHSVSPVTTGCRRVLVAELWHGPARECGHRCMARAGECECECLWGLPCTQPRCSSRKQ